MTIANVTTTLFTGFFGVGKTTAIRSLLARKPKHEKWAILVNEFGEVAVDQATLEDDSENSVTIKEIPGGCMCCIMNVPMRVAITEVLRRAKPDRLLIEPTGLGHPAAILDELRKADLQGVVDVGAVICFVDPRYVGDPRIEEVDVFRDQVHLADVLIASKADLASSDDLARFQTWAEHLFPPKLIIAQSTMGEIDLALLDHKVTDVRLPLFPNLHDHKQQAILNNIPAPTMGRPVRAENAGAGYKGCGWVFSVGDIFDQDAVIDYLGPPGPARLSSVERIKGVFRIGTEWLLIDRVKSEISVTPIAYRRDSRLEIIVSETEDVDWNEIETALIEFLK
jgi:G3E family GTPase